MLLVIGRRGSNVVSSAGAQYYISWNQWQQSIEVLRILRGSRLQRPTQKLVWFKSLSGNKILFLLWSLADSRRIAVKKYIGWQKRIERGRRLRSKIYYFIWYSKKKVLMNIRVLCSSGSNVFSSAGAQYYISLIKKQQFIGVFISCYAFDYTVQPSSLIGLNRFVVRRSCSSEAWLTGEKCLSKEEWKEDDDVKRFELDFGLPRKERGLSTNFAVTCPMRLRCCSWPWYSELYIFDSVAAVH